MIGLERFDGAPKRVGHTGHLREFFGGKFVEVFVERIARIHAVLDSIETGKKHRREGEIWICRGVRGAKFNAFCFRTGRISRNSDRGGSIARGIREIDRRLEARDEALVAVGSWICQARERRRVLQNSADEKECGFTEAGVTVPRKKRFLIFPK